MDNQTVKKNIKIVIDKEELPEVKIDQQIADGSANLSPPDKGPKRVAFDATNGSSNMGMSVISEDTPSPGEAALKKDCDACKEFDRASDDASDLDDQNKVQPVKEVTVPGKIYRELFAQFPAEPLFPKSHHSKDESPRSGGVYKFMKLTKFRGMDHGKSKFRLEAQKIEKIDFPEGVTMKKIFKVTNVINHDEKPSGDGPPPLEGAPTPDVSKKHSEMTAYGELVYQRSGQKDFITKQTMFAHEQKDEVLEENLLDVKNLLKNATSSQAANGKQPGQKNLVNLAGIEPYYTKKDRSDKTLIFESRFESGNLAAALKKDENDYYLALQNDVNTSGNTQWFFFRVSNTKSYSTVRFSMLNLCKPDSLFNEGMKVLVYSEKHAQVKDIGWHRAGTKIAYYANGIRKDGSKSFKTLYTCTFSYEFEYDDDNVYFAYCYPYTYTELVEELNTIMADPIKQQYVQKRTLTETLAGNKCEVITITSKQNPENMAQRKGVILTARVHPGESVGSWMMKGALDFLVDPESIEAEYLRQNFVFKIVPMLNPDGVINGNYRCSLAGCDLNRRWKRPSKVLHPTIFATKQLCQSFAKERDLQIFCDFHGHSRRKNIFMYGCNVPGQPEDTRLFPFIMSQICPFFVYNYSRFGNQKSKESTARMALFNELKCPAIYTIESSFCGNDMGPFKNYHFSTNNLMQTGRDFCRTLMLYLPIQIPKSIVTDFIKNIQDLYNHYKIISDSQLQPDIEVEQMVHYFERLEKVKQAGKDIQSKHIKKGLATVLRQTADIFTDGHSSSSAGSDQAPSEDNLDLEEIEKVLPVQEDPDLAIKLKKTKTLREAEIKREQEANKESNQSMLKRGKTITEGLRRKKTFLGDKNKRKKLNIAETKIEEPDEFQADDEMGKTPKSKKSDKDEERDKVVELRDPETGNIIHKKRRRKNVDSRDASTQTDRSDYMLIKQRQQEKQKQLMQLLQSKTETGEGVIETQSALEKDGISGPSVDGRLNNSKLNFQNNGLSQAINQQLLRKDLKSIIGDGGNDTALTQKLLEEYLSQQKQGLVDNIVSQYHQQQNSQSSPSGKSPQGIVQFSNFALQNQAHFTQMQAYTAEEDNQSSPINKGSQNFKTFGSASQSNVHYSPSKKHRNLIQSRVGAAQIQMNINPNQQNQNKGANAMSGPIQTSNNFFNGNNQQQKKQNNQMSNKQLKQYNQSNQKKTHWQKVSSNNHELTKLFYQLPGGTKHLVQNAIQSSNIQQQQQQQFQMMQQQHQLHTQQYQQQMLNKKQQNRKSQFMDKKFVQNQIMTPEITNKFMNNDTTNSNAELPDLQYSASGIQQSKTPNQNTRQLKQKTIGQDNHAQYNNKKNSLQVSDMMVAQGQNHSYSSKKPPVKSKLMMKEQTFSRSGGKQNPPQSASVTRSGAWQQKQVQHLAQGQIQDNYDFQLGLNKVTTNIQQEVNNSHSVKHFEKRITSVPAVSQQYQNQQQVPSYTVGNPTPMSMSSGKKQQNFVQSQSRFNQPQTTQSMSAAGLGSTFSNVYLGQALAAAQNNPQGSGNRYQNEGQKMRSSEPNQADNIIRNIKGEIMENALIQQKLKSINGDIKGIEELGDQITAEIVKQLNSQNQRGHHLQIPGASIPSTGQKQVNVYNNFQGPQSITSSNLQTSQGSVRKTGPQIRPPLNNYKATPNKETPQKESIRNSRNNGSRIQTAHVGSSIKNQSKGKNNNQYKVYNQTSAKRSLDNPTGAQKIEVVGGDNQIVNVHNQFHIIINAPDNNQVRATPSQMHQSKKSKKQGMH